MFNGIAEERLFPFMPVSIKSEHNKWRELSLVLDIGFDGEVALDEILLNQDQDGMCIGGVPGTVFGGSCQSFGSRLRNGPVATLLIVLLPGQKRNPSHAK